MIEDNNIADTEKFLDKQGDKQVKFSGLTKEEVLNYSTDPSWVKLRWILFSLFWIIWLGLLGAAIGIVVLTPGCPYRPNMNWWQNEIVYQVDVAKFKDSNGDGVGDLKGLIEKVDYFKDLGVETLCFRSNIINEESPESFLPQYQLTETLKDMKKKFKLNDIHIILDIPFKLLANDTKTRLNSWLTSFADGIRVTEVPDDVDNKVLEEFVEIVHQVGLDTFENKFIAFHPFKHDKSIKSSSTELKKMFSENVFNTLETKKEFISDLKESFVDFEDKLWPSYLSGYYGEERIKNKIEDKQRLKVAHGLLLLLKGTPFVLYGDELELSGTDNYMKWDNSINCGFSTNKTLNIQSKCEDTIRDAMSHGSGQNLIKIYKSLASLRKSPSFQWGDVTFSEKDPENIISFIREAKGYDGFLIASNINKKSGSNDFKTIHEIPKNGTISFFYSENAISANEFKTGLEISTERIILKPGELLVLKFDKRV